MKATRSRKRFNDRQLLLNFQPVEHNISGAYQIADRVDTKTINPPSLKSADFVKHSAVTLEALAERVQTDDRLRLLEPTSLPKQLRGWSPRPRPQTAIISYAAQRAYECRCTGESNDMVIRKFLGQRNAQLGRLAARLGQGSQHESRRKVPRQALRLRPCRGSLPQGRSLRRMQLPRRREAIPSPKGAEEAQR